MTANDAWDIEPQGVQSQLRLVGGHAGELVKARAAVYAALEEAGRAAGTAVPGTMARATPLHGPVPAGQPPLTAPTLGPVAAALGEYLRGRQPQIAAMAERVEAAVLGAVTATNEYVEGDLDTAKQAQDAARAVRLDLLRDLGANR
ncbi:DUF6507 family protein [Streptomyces sp. NPDC013181]|uniref:DUF6507 family protein n=1 Tax=unclassified Streptomyces TaxID=2593676 RepID=UPI0036AFE8C9